MSEVTKTTPLRLEDAVRLAFPAGGMTVSGLRTEKRKGNLVVMMLAGKEFTTLAAIEDMLNRAQRRTPVPASGGGETPRQYGSSETDRFAIAKAAAMRTALEQKERLRKEREAKAVAEGRNLRRRKPTEDKT